MSDPVILRRLITDAVYAQLDNITGLTGYRGEIPSGEHPPTIPGDTLGRVLPYWVLYPFAGTPTPEVGLDDHNADLVYTFQVTVAAGFPIDCEAAVDLVHASVFRWIPNVTGLVCGPFRPPLGFDAGPIRRDPDTVQPPRYFVPLQYRNTVTAN